MPRIYDMDKLTISPYAVSMGLKKYKEKEVIGFDTETHNGKATLITDSNSRSSKLKNINDIIQFMFYGNNYLKTHNFFFNLEYDTNAIIKHLPKNNLLELIKFDKTMIKLNDKTFIFRIIPRKNFSIRYVFESKNKIISKTVNFFDIYQFYQIGNLEKTFNTTFSNETFKKSMDSSKQFPLNKITQEDIDYCIGDSIACQKLAKNFVDMTNKIVYVNKFYSPASLARSLLKKNLLKPYKFKKSLIQQYALRTYNGGRFECISRGFFTEDQPLFMVDVNSAYPYVINNLLDLSGGVKRYDDYLFESKHSFFKCEIKINDDFLISPLKKYLDKQSLLVYPIGKFKEIYITKIEYELLMKLDIKVNVKKGLHIIGKDIIKPYSYVKGLYETRMKYKKENNPLQLPLKLGANAMYGLFIQTIGSYTKKDSWTHEEEININNIMIVENGYTKLLVKEYKTGVFYNPIYATEITSAIRCKLFEDSMKYKDDIVMFATDSITMTKKPKVKISDKLGDYSITNKMGGLVLGSGIYSLFEIDNPQNVKQGFRGFGKKTDVLKIAKNNPTKGEYKYLKRSPFKLKESRLKLDELNEFTKKEKKLLVNFDKKRIWSENAKDFDYLLKNIIGSKPLSI